MEGKGVEKDVEEAKAWISRSAKKGYDKAIEYKKKQGW
jgi:TPR repeat protein